MWCVNLKISRDEGILVKSYSKYSNKSYVGKKKSLVSIDLRILPLSKRH